MYRFDKEMTPVFYGPSLIKIAHYQAGPYELCFRTHWHDRVEILRIRNGVLLEGYDDKLEKRFPGEIIILPPGMPHKGITEETSVEYDVFMFDIRTFYNETDVSKKLFSAVFDGRAHFLHVTDNSEIRDCLDRLSQTKETELEALQRIAGIYQLLYLLFEHALLHIDEKTSTNQKFQSVLQYMAEHFTQDISTASLSRQFGYSKEYFCRSFKEHIGLTPMKYLRILRLEKAYQMLMNSNVPIEVIAEACGFQDANYFTRCFKAHFGTPPSKTRHDFQ